MKSKNLFFLAIIFCIYSCDAPKTNTPAENKTEKKVEKRNQLDGQPISRKSLTDSNTDKVLAYFNALETGDGSFFRLNVSKENHVQHNPNFSDGNKGYKELVTKYKNNPPKVDVYRLTEFDNYVFAHSVLKDSLNSYACMDIFKFSNGKIREHFFGQETITQIGETAASISYSGPTLSTSDEFDAQRVKIAANFVRYSRIEGDQNKNARMVSITEFVEHNPYLHKSSNPVGNYYYDLKSAGIEQEYEEIITAVGGGNFVVTVSSGTRNGKLVQIFDLFRFENLQIVEHWDVIQSS